MSADNYDKSSDMHMLKSTLGIKNVWGQSEVAIIFVYIQQKFDI